MDFGDPFGDVEMNKYNFYSDDEDTSVLDDFTSDLGFHTVHPFQPQPDPFKPEQPPAQFHSQSHYPSFHEQPAFHQERPPFHQEHHNTFHHERPPFHQEHHNTFHQEHHNTFHQEHHNTFHHERPSFPHQRPDQSCQQHERPSDPFFKQEQQDPQLREASPFNSFHPPSHHEEPRFSPPPMSATSQPEPGMISDHWTDTSPVRSERGDRTDEMCDADKYLYNGLEDIDHTLQYHFAGRQFPRHVSKRAKEIFKRSYELQSQQKEGDVAFRRNRGDVSRRKRFARRKAFVVTAIVVALKEFGLSLDGRVRQSDSQVITALSNTVPGGSNIRLTSVKSCCRTLQLTDIRFR